jgi:hypothetical protein
MFMFIAVNEMDRPEPRSGTWIEAIGELESSVYRRYLLCVYWAITT